MTEAQIAFVPNQQSGLEEFAGGSPNAVNIVVDKLGAIRRRPAISVVDFAPTGAVDALGIDGVFVTVSGRVFASGGKAPSRHLYLVENGAFVDLSSIPNSDLRGNFRPVFAETESILLVSGGDQIQKIILADGSSSRLGGNPPLASHVAANSSRVLANNATVNRGQIAYSAPAQGSAYSGFETWDITDNGGFFTAEARPDPVLAIYENTNEVFAFGTTSLQVFDPDPVFVWSPVAAKEFGCIAPYSVVKVDQNFIWLDHLRRVVSSDGRSATVLSNDIQRTLDSIVTINDAFGYRCKVGYIDAYCLCFPTDGRTFVYQQSAGWSTWMSWDPDTNNFSRLQVNAAAVHPLTGQVVVGTLDGHIARLQLGQATDLGGTPIAVSVTSGAQNRGTDARKQCRSVRLTLRRGDTASLTSEPVASLSWRDDDGEWCPPYQVGLGLAGDHDIVVVLRSLGVYRRRQWKFEFDGTDDIVLVSAVEDFEVLGG